MRQQPLRVLPLALIIGACAHETSLGGRPNIPPDVPDGVVQAVVQQEPAVDAGTLQYVVRVVGPTTPFAAYQGVVTFDPRELDVVAVRVPTASGGETHLVNNTRVTEGSLRFAAYAPERFETDEAFRIVVRPRGSGVPAITASLEVVGTEKGRVIDAARLRHSDGVHDARGARLR